MPSKGNGLGFYELWPETRLMLAEVIAEHPLFSLPLTQKRCAVCQDRAALFFGCFYIEGSRQDREAREDKLSKWAKALRRRAQPNKSLPDAHFLSIAENKLVRQEESTTGASYGKPRCGVCVNDQFRVPLKADDPRQLVADLALLQFEEEHAEGVAEAERLLGGGRNDDQND